MKKFKKCLKFFLWGFPGIIVSALFHAVAVYLISHELFEKAIEAIEAAVEAGTMGQLFADYLNYLMFVTSNQLHYYLIFSFVISLFFFTIVFACHRYMVTNGNLTIEGKSSGRLSIISLLSLINPIGHLKTIFHLHDFHHIYHKHVCIINDLPKKHNLPLDTPAVQVAIDELLFKAKAILDSLLFDDVAVHIKLFENKNVHELCYAEREQSQLRAYRRNPSDRELMKRKSGLRCRNQIELFSSDPCQKLSDIDDLKRNFPRKDKPGRLRTSSAYNYVLQPNDHKFFVCNDLKRAEADGLFYSNSDNWEDYYSSLAVFLIWEPGGGVAQVGKANRKPLGMFIVDSYSKGRFDRWRLRAVAGLLSHHLYDFFTAISAPYSAFATGAGAVAPLRAAGRPKRK